MKKIISLILKWPLMHAMSAQKVNEVKVTHLLLSHRLAMELAESEVPYYQLNS